MTRENFAESLKKLFPKSDAAHAEGWVAFAADNVERGQYVGFTPDPDPETAVGRWLETTLAALQVVKGQFGEEIGQKVCELSAQKLSLYPYEMEKAALAIQQGCSLSDIEEMMVSGALEREDAWFPQLDEASQEAQEADIQTLKL